MKALDHSTLNNGFPEMEAIAMGNEITFDWVFRAYHAPLCHFCEQLTGTDAQDIVAELFTTLWKKNITFDSKQHVQSYLYRSARNACYNLLQRGKMITLKHEQLAAVNETEADEDYLSAMIRSEVWGEIYRAIHNLPSQCSKVISMSYIDGKTNQEIADELELSQQTVKNYKQRGLHILKDKLPENLLVFLLFYQYLK